MISVRLTEKKELELDSLSEKVRVGDNMISGFEVSLPETIGTHPISECDVRLFTVLENGDTFAYDVNGSGSVVDISYDLTESEQEITVFLEITSGGEVVGKTEAKTFRVFPSPNGGEELIHRDELLRRSAELDVANERIAGYLGDFLAIRTAVGEYNVTIPDVADTSDYPEYIRQIYHADTNTIRKLIENTIDRIDVPDGTSAIPAYRFYHDTGLKTITLPSSVQRIGDMAFEYSALENITVAPGLSSIGNHAFAGCTGLSSLNMPDTLTEVKERAFDGCRNLATVRLSRALTAISNYCFLGCLSLQSVEIPHGVESLGTNAFSNCTALETVFIPNTVTYATNYPFGACQNLLNVTIEEGFNCNNLSLESSTRYSAETIVGWLNALADRTGQTPYKLIIGNVNINKLTAAQKAIASSKNWTLA